MTDHLLIPRAPFDAEEPWATPAWCVPVRLRRATDGATPRLATSVAAFFDDEYLTVIFCCTDDRIQASHLEHDAPLYEEDVVEVFLAAEAPSRYFELEVSPRGTLFDALVDSPLGVREGMRVDRAWTCDGLWAAVRNLTESNGGMSVDIVIRIPFRGLGRTTPVSGETWRANFFRIDRHPQRGDEFSAWQPTMKQPADFHVTAAFGTLRFAV